VPTIVKNGSSQAADRGDLDMKQCECEIHKTPPKTCGFSKVLTEKLHK
jgi:hypothetical protein